MIIKNLLEKSITMMNNKIIKYNICEHKHDNQIHYGIQIIEKNGRNYKEEIIKGISPNKNFVYSLLLYLYENIIDTVHFKDIVNDYMMQIEYSV